MTPAAAGEAAHFLERLREMERAGFNDSTIDYVFGTLDDALLEGRFAFVDAVLRAFDPACVSLPVSLSVLTAALWGRAELSERTGAAGRVSQHILASDRSADHDALMQGLW